MSRSDTPAMTPGQVRGFLLLMSRYQTVMQQAGMIRLQKLFRFTNGARYDGHRCALTEQGV